jgi:hypothetical protein
MKEFIRCEHLSSTGSWGRKVRCCNAAKVGGFCGVHTPEAVAARKAKKQARVDAKIDAFDRQVKARITNSRKLQLCDELLPAIQTVLDGWDNWAERGRCEEGIEQVRTILKKYEEVL